MAMSTEPPQRAEQLRRDIEYHNRRYYDLDEPEITDADYDAWCGSSRRWRRSTRI